MITATVSGSFHRHMDAIAEAVTALSELGVRVLSPAEPRIVASIDGFLFVASDRLRSVRLVQDRHLESIRASAFLWLVAPDGYVGQSASMELGFAVANEVPVYCQNTLPDLTLRQYVKVTPSMAEAVRLASIAASTAPQPLVIDPTATAEVAHSVIERLHSLLTRPAASTPPGSIALEAYGLREHLSGLLTLPCTSVPPEVN